MKKVFRRIVDAAGRVVVEEVPPPTVSPRRVVVRTACSVISSGTESATLSRGVFQLVRETLEDPWRRKAVREAVLGGTPVETVRRIRNELFKLRAIGYSGAGTVVAVGRDVEGIRPGDRVAFAGEGHAEVVSAVRTRVAKVPEGVSFEEAAFGTIGAVALHAVRRAEAALRERVVVIGLGLIGNLTAQVARAAGAEVLGIDPSNAARALAEKCGVSRLVDPSSENPEEAVRSWTAGFGADRVLVCASGKDRSIANLALRLAREKGRVVFVGIVPMDLERMPFFRKELDLGFSRAYGAGAYDPEYEERGNDYPFAYARWTEGRNIASFLELVAEKKVDVRALVGGEFPVEEAQRAYDAVRNRKLPAPTALLRYPDAAEAAPAPTLSLPRPRPGASGRRVALVGAGRFATSYRWPALRKAGFALSAVVSRNGDAAADLARRAGAACATTDYREAIARDDVDLVVVATRHDTHAEIAAAACRAGKAVFVEKPLALSHEGLEDLARAVAEGGAPFAVGFNRRHAAPVARLGEILRGREGPFFIDVHVVVARLPDEHWTLDPEEGGGRLVAECDHFFDLIAFLAGSPPLRVLASTVPAEGETLRRSCHFAVRVDLADGSVGTLTYSDRGGAAYPRERYRVTGGGLVAEVHDLAALEVYETRRRRFRFGKDLGFEAECASLARFLSGGEAPNTATLADGLRADAAALAAFESLELGEPRRVRLPA